MKRFVGLAFLILIILSSCQRQNPVCPEGSVTYYSTIDELRTSEPPAQNSLNDFQIPVDLNGKTILVNEVVQGPLCSGIWSGTVYVACDVGVLEWEEASTFLKDCDLVIKPDAVIYVAAHNNAPHYKGCSCHTGELAEDY